MATQTSDARRRLESIDLVRGLAIVFMALDHVREAVAADRIPSSLEGVSLLLFLTRWITHFCAPTFILLAGTGASLAASRGLRPGELSGYLLSRGLWLVALDVLALNSSFNVHNIGLGVLWAIGWSMVLLAPCVALPVPWLILGGGVMVLGHNLLDHVVLAQPGWLHGLWMILHTGGRLEYAPGFLLRIQYPLIPWVGVMLLGFALGRSYAWPPPVRRRLLLSAGALLLLAFVVLRTVNRYGDPHRWLYSGVQALSGMSFLNCEKYPPSLLFLLMTLGPVLILLGLVDGRKVTGWGPVLVYGRVPLFFYLLHLPLIRLTAAALKWFFLEPSAPGFSLLVVYPVWLLVVVVLYVPCRWYDTAKRKHRWWILRFI